MLRLTPPAHERLVLARTFEARYTGAEANVAVSLATFGLRASVVSRVPANEIGQACLNYLRQFGVGTQHVAVGGDRLGLLYVEQGCGPRPWSVIYDRGHSSFEECCPEDFDWEDILDDASWLHFSGTAPSRGPRVVQALSDAIATARRLDVRVSCDVNYRSLLWSRDAAAAALAPLVEDIEILIGGPEDACMLLGPQSEGTGPEELGRALIERFGVRACLLSLRTTGASWDGALTALLTTPEGQWRSAAMDYTVVDRLGGGDALAAGAIHGFLTGREPQDTVAFAVAAAVLKHTIPGDLNLATAAEVERLLAGEPGGRPRR